MKIGIITFHWPENYGAVLQAYALQSYFDDKGHDVKIINYKPLNQSLYYLSIPLHPTQLKHIGGIYRKKRKNCLLNRFRKKYLHLTKRVYSCDQLMSTRLDFDILVSGSDQVLNPSFTSWGERKPTPTYYLPFGGGKKVGYALSFGCTEYPNDAKQYAERWIQNFDSIGVRENTGLEVLRQLGYEKEQRVVPDPTILYGDHLFDRIAINKTDQHYLCVYVLRHSIKIDAEDVSYMDEDHMPLDMESWLGQIIHSKGLVTNSYHGMIMAILAHVPFVALLETDRGTGMNDRFCTLLGRLNLMDRILPIGTGSSEILTVLSHHIDWGMTDKCVEEYRQVGKDFLDIIISEQKA